METRSLSLMQISESVNPYLVEIRFTVICGPYVLPWVIVLLMERTRGRVLTLGDRRPLSSPLMMAVVPEL